MKQYTTPTINVRMEGYGDVLSSADIIVVTVSDGTTDIDLIPTIDSETLTVTLTQEQTASLEVGPIFVEVTISVMGHVFKSKTMKTRMEEAIRDEVM